MKYQSLKTAFAVSTTLVLAVPANAQDSENADNNTQTDDEIIVTASGFEQERSQTGQAITVIGRDRLEQLQSSSIADTLKIVPGISVATRGPIGGQTSVFIRGANSSQTLVLVDGVRINDPSSPNGAFDFGALLTGNIGKVEVLRGPNSVIWGSQAIGGVIDVQSILPTETLAFRGMGEYGFSNTARINANVSGRSGKLEGSVGGAYFRTDGISALAGGTEKDGYKNFSGNGRLKINVTDAFSLDFRGYYNRGTIEYDSPFGAGANALPISRNRQFLSYIGANFDLADGKFRNRLSYTRTHITRIGSDPVVGSFNNFDVKGTINRLEYRGIFDIADAATLIFGLENERVFSRISFEGAVPTLARNRVTSGFGQLVLRPFRGLTLTGGVRYDDYRDYGGQTTFGGNLAYTPNGGNTVLRATYAEGFRAPTLSEGQPPFGNPALKPETAQNFDMGIEHRFLAGKAQIYATYFNRRSDDLIAFSFATFQSENIARVRTEGAEFGIALQPTVNLNLQANFTSTDAINRSPGSNLGKRLALRPQHQGSLSIDWQSPWKFDLGATLLLAGDSFDNAANSVRLDGYALANIRVSYPISQRIRFTARIENLFDEEYQTVAGYDTYGRGAYAGIGLNF
jgi:vitamin B12 transporter